MEKFLAMAWTKDADVTAAIKRVVACPDETGAGTLFELDGGERRRVYTWATFESLHDTEEAAELWVAGHLGKIAAAIQAKADEFRDAAVSRAAKNQVAVIA